MLNNQRVPSTINVRLDEHLRITAASRSSDDHQIFVRMNISRLGGLTSPNESAIFILMNEEASIGERIRERRKALGISQRDLSELAGVSLHTLSDIESGKGNPTRATLGGVLTPLGMVLSIRVRGVG